jgi:Set1/Ash2 histone methyltransferase complex subunit ASH2
MEYSILDYISSKRIDEFSKRYYDTIQNNVKDYSPNIRIGLINEKGDLDLPLGAERYSYGFRVSNGILIHDGDYLNSGYNYSKGDIIGVLVNLKPPRPDFLKKDNEDEVNKECNLKFFINGREVETRFIGLYEGSYKPAVTLYNFAKASINFGPNFKYTNFDEYNSIKQYYD